MQSLLRQDSGQERDIGYITRDDEGDQNMLPLLHGKNAKSRTVVKNAVSSDNCLRLSVIKSEKNNNIFYKCYYNIENTRHIEVTLSTLHSRRTNK